MEKKPGGTKKGQQEEEKEPAGGEGFMMEEVKADDALNPIFLNETECYNPLRFGRVMHGT